MSENTSLPKPGGLLPLVRFPLCLSFLLLIVWQLLRVVLWMRFAPPGLGASEVFRVFGTGFLADVAAALAGTTLIIGLCALLSGVLALPSLLLIPLGIRAWNPTRRVLFRIAMTVALMVVLF
ncbi:MAG: hypothetical protein ACKOKG_04055, partial [Verrucomicrobiota bacterium]